MTTSKRSLRPTFIKFETVGDSVRGKLIGVSHVEISEVAVPKYTVETAEGMASFLGTVQIAEALEMVRLGTEIEVRFMESIKGKGGRQIKEFEVFAYVTEE